ncbi:rhodanese-like domain-containing protein [Sorangium sp. So ce1000]|uniref:rhodanese-like domain-containing protein n=1 Tax=Sorangium sp. So ce1000 TaxID=3133325 RepID=UPI003F5F22B9
MADIKRISPQQAKKLIDEEGYLYLDVRSEPEYAAGHPSGAHNVPLMHAGAGGMKPNPDFLDVVRALYPTDAKIIVGCKAGQRSMRAAEAMVSAGYTAVIDQRAGFDGPRDAFGAITEPGWGPSGLPVETTTAGGSYAELRKKAGR